MSPPRFSIVIPTRNRPALLGYAIQSALAQSGDDFEVVISDNSTDQETRGLVQRLADPRLRYTSPPKPLSHMSDSWEFAVQQACGQYVTFLCDDDALSPHLLDRLRKTLEEHGRPDLITWKEAGYFHSNWTEADKRNSLWISPGSGQCQTFQSKESLRHIFGHLWPGIPVPKMLQSLCSRKVIEEVKAVAGRFFIPTCPDLSTSVFTLAMRDSYVHIDEPLMLSGSAAESTGATQWTTKGETWKRFYRDHDGEKTYACLPLNTYIGINACAQTLVDAKKHMPEHLRDMEVNWAVYFKCYLDSLNHLEAAGVNVIRERTEYSKVLATQLPQVQAETTEMVSKANGSGLRRVLRTAINATLGMQQLERLLRPSLRRSKTRIVAGAQGGFSNIFECAQKLPHLLSN